MNLRTKWGEARKKPIVILFREVEPNFAHNIELIKTREGTLQGYMGKDYVIQGVKGEIYPIDKLIFHETYDVITPIRSSGEKMNE